MFTLRERAWLYIAGIWLYLVLVAWIMIAAALLAFLTLVYRRVSASYAQAAAEAPETAESSSRPVDE